MEWIIFIIFVAVYIGGRYYDIQSSENFQNYGLKEGVKFSRDKYGLFNRSKNILGSAVLLGIAVAIAVFYRPYGGLMIILPLALFSYFVAFTNFRHQKQKRIQQIAWLRELKAENDKPLHELNHIFTKLGAFITREDRRYYELFKFAYSTRDATPDANLEVAEKLVTLSKRDEKDWFPVDR